MEYRILTVNEYEKNKMILPNPERRFWLDPCGIPGDGHFPVVNEDGLRSGTGELPNTETVFLRPVIEYAKDEARPYFKKGDRLDLYGYGFTAVSDTVLVCDRCISEYKFNDKPCLFKDSFLCYVLYQIFIEKQAEASKSEAFAAKKSKESLIADIYRNSLKSGSSGGQLIAGRLLSGAGLLGIGFGLGMLLTGGALGILVPVLGAAGVVGGEILSGIGRKNRITDGSEYLSENIRPLLTEVKLVAGADEGKPALADYTENGGFETSAIDNSVIKDKFAEINRLIDKIEESGNRGIIAKLKGFYIPETKKLYGITLQFQADAIETEQTKECMNMVSDSLDKTISLLKTEYDKTNEDKLQDLSIDIGIKQKMIDMNETEKKMDITLEK